jgi:hypothetical protein
MPTECLKKGKKIFMEKNREKISSVGGKLCRYLNRPKLFAENFAIK